MSSPGNLPRHKEDIIRIIDLAFVKFERRLQACLDEASERIVTEAETAQTYVKGQLSLLKSNILKGLDDPETGTVPRRRHAAPMVRTEPPVKKRWLAENALGVPRVTVKKTRYSDIGIDEARRELAAERGAQKQKLAVEKNARKERRAIEKSVKKEQLLAKKGTTDLGGKKGEGPSASVNESSSEEGKEEDEAEGSEHDLYSSESEGSGSEGYETPPSPTPAKRRESRPTLPDRRSNPHVSYPGAPIRGL
ncbi:hypothetical protein EV426DRAFT_701690 [Tirmania nivea]|nr:hypothetical protein EV426DRAFT_701690 [Tirmania nivea]